MIVFLNGEFLPREQARISPFDRGFLFGDGVYEGLRAIATTHDTGHTGTRIIGLDLHIERLRRALVEAAITYNPARLGDITQRLLAANNLLDAFVYWQVTRGTPTAGEPLRQRVPPHGGLSAGPTVFGYCAPQPALDAIESAGPNTRSAATITDPRWIMGHLKSIALAGNVLAAIEADHRAADEAILIRQGLVVEGLATNVLIVTSDGRLATPSLDSAPMLAGITRAILIHELGAELEVRPVAIDELRDAREVMLCGSSTMVASIVRLDRRPIGDGTPGPVARRLLALLLDAIRLHRDDRLPHTLLEPTAFQGWEHSCST